MGDVVDYDYGNKRQWRRWVWNQISARTPSDSVVLFLAGERALDIKYAERKGFRSQNMIAVDSRAEVVSTLRKKGVLAIQGELLDVLWSWPQNFPVGAVVADFCCGLEQRIVRRVAPVVWCHKAFQQTSFVFNFLRGRDASSKNLREPLRCETKHRGSMLFGHVAAWATVGGNLDGLSKEDEWRLGQIIIGAMNPREMTYSSTAGTQKFDSVVFTSAARKFGIEHQDLASHVSVAASAQLLRRRIAAARAHHTRRQPGWGA